jgi:hypothetical protein
MNKFNISLARIEVTIPGLEDGQVRITFQIEGASIKFQVPIAVKMCDFDDTEMVQAAHNILHQAFLELASPKQRMAAVSTRSSTTFEHKPSIRRSPYRSVNMPFGGCAVLTFTL